MTKRDLQNQIDALREQIILANGRIRSLEYDFNMQNADVVELEGSKVGKYLSYTTTGNPTADVVEVVRCKDCVHHKNAPKTTDVWCDRLDGLLPKDWFCADGKRREDD